MLRSKPLLFISLFIIISDILFVAVNHYSTLNTLKSDTRKWARDQQHMFNLMVEQKATTMQHLATYVANDGDIQRLFLYGKQLLEAKGGDHLAPGVQYLRGQLYDFVAPSWAEMVSAYDVRQLHFHLGPGSTSYLRVHRPEKFGDNMDNVRYTVVDVNQKLRPTKGFETGRVYSGIRGVVPVYAHNAYKEKVHIGALEAGTSFAYTLRTLQQELESNLAVLLTHEHVTENMWPDFITNHFTDDKVVGDYFIEACSHKTGGKKFLQLETVLESITDSPSAEIIHANGIWQLSSFPLRDYRGSLNQNLPNAGVVLIWRDASDQWELVRQSLVTSITYAIIALVLFEVVLIYGWKFSQKRLNSIISSQTAKLEKLANFDGLTDLYNRRAIEDMLQREIDRSERYGTFLSVMLFDLDHFKRVNDTYGHHVGDEVLRQTAVLVKAAIRKNDYAGRWGGEEFVVIVPDTHLDSGVQLAERIRNDVVTHVFEQVGTVTMSTGIGRYQPGEGGDRLIKRIDDALYRAKEKGRNRIEVTY